MTITADSIENLADEQARALAQAGFTAHCNDFDKLSQLEETMCFLFETLDSEQFLGVIKTLHDALDCPLLMMDCIGDDEDALVFFVMSYMFTFSEAVLEIGLHEACEVES